MLGGQKIKVDSRGSGLIKCFWPCQPKGCSWVGTCLEG